MARTPTQAWPVSTDWPSSINGAQAVRSPIFGACATPLSWQAMHTAWYTCSPVLWPCSKGGCANAAWENTSAKTPKDKRLRKDIRHITPQQNRKEQEPNAHRRRHAPKPHARLRHHGVTLTC